jgi:hypothetical protein
VTVDVTGGLEFVRAARQVGLTRRDLAENPPTTDCEDRYRRRRRPEITEPWPFRPSLPLGESLTNLGEFFSSANQTFAAGFALRALPRPLFSDAQGLF